MKEVKHIKCHPFWESYDDFSSHRPALWLASTKHLQGNVTEFGCGYGSTTPLHEHCKNFGRQFFSYETNRDWGKKFPEVRIVDEYSKIHIGSPENREGILFIDSAPAEERKILLENHANDVDVIVIHDTEIGSEYVYGLMNILRTFKYRLDYLPKGNPATSIVSNFINVEEWA